MLQGIETPILIKHGITCKPLLLDIEESSNNTFLLDGVSEDIGALLPEDIFLKLSDSRYITIKPIKFEDWASIFPDVKTQYTEPVKMNAAKAGKQIPVPEYIKDEISSLSKSDFSDICSKVVGYNPSNIPLYRHSAVSGHVEKQGVYTILHFVANKLLINEPYRLDVIEFINSLYKSVNLENFAVIKSPEIFSYLEKWNKYSDENVTSVLPLYLQKNDRISCYLNINKLQVFVVNLAASTVEITNLPSLDWLYRFCFTSGFINDVTQVVAERINGICRKYLDRLCQSVSWKAIAGEREVFFEQGDRRFVRSKNLDKVCFLTCVEEARLIYKISQDSIVDVDHDVTLWIDETKAADNTELSFLLYNRLPKLTTDNISELVKKAVTRRFTSFYERKKMVDDLLWAPLYDKSYFLSPFQRSFLICLNKSVLPSFLNNDQDEATTKKYFSAYDSILKIVFKSNSDSFAIFCRDVKRHFFEAGVFKPEINSDLSALVSSLASEGLDLLNCLQCKDIRSKQALTKLVSDPVYQVEKIYSISLINAPIGRDWWLAGYEIASNQEGWYAFRNDGYILEGVSTRTKLVEKLLKLVKQSHIKEVNNEVRYFCGNGMSYLLPEDYSLNDMATEVDPYSNAPIKKTLDYSSSQETIGNHLKEFINDTNLEEQAVLEAINLLGEVLGLNKETLYFNHNLSTHITGDHSFINIALWNSVYHSQCSAGGIVKAWGSLFYKSLVSGSSNTDSGLYPPSVEDPKISTLFDSLLYKKSQILHSVQLYDFESDVIQEAKSRYDIAIEGISNGMSENEFSKLMVAVYDCVEDPKDPLLMAISLIYSNREKESSTRVVLKEFVKKNLEYSYEQKSSDFATGESLFTRMLESYVYDALEDAGIRNDLLLYSGRNKQRLCEWVYPEGDERYQIREAFNEFFWASHHA